MSLLLDPFCWSYYIAASNSLAQGPLIAPWRYEKQTLSVYFCSFKIDCTVLGTGLGHAVNPTEVVDFEVSGIRPIHTNSGSGPLS